MNNLSKKILSKLFSIRFVSKLICVATGYTNHRYIVKWEIEFHPTLIYRSNGSPNDPIKEQKIWR